MSLSAPRVVVEIVRTLLQEGQTKEGRVGVSLSILSDGGKEPRKL